MRTGGTMNTTSSAPMAQHSPWHSPVPYLFGGLAAMLGLIAFALLILACSFWKLSGYMDNGESGEQDIENGDEKAEEAIKIPMDFEPKVVVIMAGDEKPTFLATPITSRASSFGDNNKNNKEESEKSEKADESKQETDNQHQEQQTEMGNQHQEQQIDRRETQETQNQ